MSERELKRRQCIPQTRKSPSILSVNDPKLFCLLRTYIVTELERRFLADLKPDGLNDMLIRNNSEGTCEWILHSREFHDWLNLSGSESTLWIRGPSGVGKTVLARFLYLKLYDDLSADPSLPIVQRIQWASATTKPHTTSFKVLAYFFGSGNSTRNKGLSVLQSLLYQVLSTDQRLFRYVHGKQFFRQPQRRDFDQYMKLLSAVLQDVSLSGTVIVLDACDECEEASRSLLIKSLVAIASQSRVKMLITSRSQSAVEIEPSIRMTLGYLDEDIDRDINRYLTTSVKDIVGKRRLSAQLEQKIVSQLMKIPSKSYLWIQLVLQRIEKALTLRDLRKKLDQLPPSLPKLYSEVLDHCHGLTAITLRRTLYFVMVAEESLHIQELSALLAISQTGDLQARSSQGSDRTKQWMEIAENLRVEETLVNKPMNFEDFMPHFRPLLRINEGCISLVHFTLQEYLQQRSQTAHFQATFGVSWPDHSTRGDTMPVVHATMAILCLQYLLAAFRDRSDPLGFRVFAAIHWTEHTRKAGECQNEVLKALITTFFDTTEFISAWLDILRSSKYAHKWVIPSTSVVGLILAAFDLGSLYGDLLGISWESLATKDLNQRTALHFAAANSAISSIYWIKGVCTNGGLSFDCLSSETDKSFQIPIHLAAKHGHIRIVEMLLEMTNSEVPFDGNVFEIMASNGHKELFKILYSRTKAQDPDQLIHLLKQAAKLDIIDLMLEISGHLHSLVDKGLISPTDLSDNRISVLHAALRMQSTAVIDFLLENEDFRDALDRKRWTALHVAADEGNEAVASRLIERGVWIYALNSQGDAALHIATRKGFAGVVRLLCDKGSRVDLQNSLGQLPAHLAAEIGDEEILQTLCKYNSNFLPMDKEGRTVLHAASKAGPEATVHILLAIGINVNAEDFHGRTPAHYAVESRDLKILYSLLIAGADPRAPDRDHICPIHLAAEQGSELLIRELSKVGVNPNCRDSQGRTPLHHSCGSKGSTLTAANMLLESGAEVGVSDSKGVHPLHLAAEQGFESLLRLLISHGADVNCLDAEGRTPMHYGCFSKWSTTAVVKLLIRSGSKIDGPDSGMNTPLSYAKQNNKSSVVKILIDAGARY